MPCISVSDFAKPLGFRTDKLELPEWGDDAYILLRAMSVDDFLELKSKYAEDASNFAFLSDVVSMCAVNDDGSMMFATPDDTKVISSKSIELLDRIANFALDLSGIAEKKS